MSHQPNCSVCGQFVGRKVRVEKFDPLVVTCDLCVYEEELEEQRQRNARVASARATWRRKWLSVNV